MKMRRANNKDEQRRTVDKALTKRLLEIDQVIKGQRVTLCLTDPETTLLSLRVTTVISLPGEDWVAILFFNQPSECYDWRGFAVKVMNKLIS
jgi:hypothetical protein